MGAAASIEQVISGTPDAGWIPARLLEGLHPFFALDRTWRFRYLNAAAEQLLGRTRAELIDRPLWEAFPNLVGSRLEQQLRRASRERERVTFEELWQPRSLWLEATADPWEDGVAVFLRDISDRKRRTRRELYFRAAGEAISAAQDLREALSAFARSTAALTGWPYAETWMVGGDGRLRCADVVRFDRPGCAELERSARAHPVEHVSGPLAAALRLRRPTLVEQLSPLGEERARLAEQAGFGSVVVAPVLVQESVAAAVLFFRDRGADDDWVRVLDEQHEIAQLFERRSALDALRASEERHRLLFEESPAPMWIYEPETLRFLAVNNAAIQLYGFSREEFLGMGLGDIRPPEELPALLRVQADVHGPHGWRANFLRHWRKDRSPLQVNVASHPLRLDGRQVRVSVISDVSAMQEASGKLREQAALLDAANDAIVVRGLDEVVTYWNQGAERTYGWTAAEAVGRPFAALTSPRSETFEDARGALARTGHWMGELAHELRDKRQVVVATRWTLVKDERGDPRSILSIGTDVTERKKLETQYLRAQRMESIGTLAGGIAHDLNNVLTPILVTVPLLREPTVTEDQREMLDSIEAAAQRGAAMVRQVLLFARGLSGDRLPVKPQALLEETRRIVSDSMPKTIAVRVAASGELPLIEGDPTQLQQVLINLAVNARDAMPEGGTLTLGCQAAFLDAGYVAMNPTARPGAYAVLEVTDTGVGIPPEIRDRIFDPFFTTKEVGKGTGLGLSTSMAIVKGHGGFFNVYSEPGKGTTFKLYLPALEGSARHQEEEHVEEAALPRGAGELILVVDDEAPIRAVARRALEYYGYRVVDAANGAEALAVFARSASDVQAVLLDMSMPVMDGPSTIRALQHLHPAVKIVAASGLGGSGSFARASAAGVRHFLQKPFTTPALLATIREALDGKGGEG